MQKKLFTIIFVSVLAITALVGCGNTSTNVTDETKAVETTEETKVIETVAEVPHEHEFTEEVTKEPTCLEAGEKTLTCECGETSTVAIDALGHEFTDYVSNEDATYEADGTETAKCNNCDETDTRVAEGSMLTYTYEEMDATKYVKSTVNVRSLPTTDGEKLGGLSLNDEVKVTGKCNETGWYRIEYKDSVAYVSDSYLVDNKVEVAKAPASNSDNGGSSKAFPYELYTMYDNGTITYCYVPSGSYYKDYSSAYDASAAINRSRFPYDGSGHEMDAGIAADGGNTNGTTYTGYKTADGRKIIKVYCY